MPDENRGTAPGNKTGQEQQTPPGTEAPPAVPAPPAMPKIEDDVEAAESDSRADSENRSEAEQIQQTVSRHVLIDSFFTAIIAIATVIQVGIAWYQWDVMNRGLEQTDATIRQMRIERRPWLSIAATGEAVIKDNGEFVWTMTVENSGDTPAWIDRIRGRGFAEKDGAAIDNRVLGIKEWMTVALQGGGVIPPAESIQFPTITDLNDSPGDSEQVKKDELILYVFKVVEYHDSDGRNHWTLACFFYDRELKRLRIYRKYNDMDQGDGDDLPIWAR